jgi:2'-5' RNA ligase
VIAAANARLFFALWPDTVTATAITTNLDNVVPKPEGQRVATEKLHLTLAFLGVVTADAQHCLIQAAQQINSGCFDLTLDGYGYFPKPNVIWYGPTVIPPPLAQLQIQLRERLRGCGITPDDRPFTPHMTVVRKARNGVLPQHSEPLRWPVSEFCLAASVTYATGAQYQIVRRWPLRAY